MAEPASTSPAVLSVLLDAIADRDPCPKAPKWEREAAGGFMAAKWHTCTGCRGDGTVKRRNHRATCTVCHGAGRWRVDAYDDKNRPVEPNSRGASELTLGEFYDIAQDVARDKDERALRVFERHIERNIDRLLGLNVDLQRQVLEAHPCWQQLDDALHGMAQAAPSHHRALRWTHLDRLPLGPNLTALYDDALLILGDALGPGFRAPRWAITRADEHLRQQRAAKAVAAQKSQRWPDPTVRAAEAKRLQTQGRTVRWIAKQLGVGPNVIQRDLAA